MPVMRERCAEEQSMSAGDMGLVWSYLLSLPWALLWGPSHPWQVLCWWLGASGMHLPLCSSGDANVCLGVQGRCVSSLTFTVWRGVCHNFVALVYTLLGWCYIAMCVFKQLGAQRTGLAGAVIQCCRQAWLAIHHPCGRTVRSKGGIAFN